MVTWQLRNEPGWRGVFSRQEAAGAIPNGTRIVKTHSEGADANPVGTTGRVLGSIEHPEHGMGYFVEWDVMPRTAVFVVGAKIAAVQ